MEFLPDSDALSSATSAKWECGSNTAPVVKQNSSIARNYAPEENETDGDKFEFDESFDELTQSSLVSALMAGLYYIPPERILRHQMGWGRRIRYDGKLLMQLQYDTSYDLFWQHTIMFSQHGRPFECRNS